jgi:hypothetical protein
MTLRRLPALQYLVLIVLCASPETARAQAVPPWKAQLMPWETHAGQPRLWRDDRRLSGRAAPGFLDDFPVVFANPDSARGGLHEIMWVRVIAYDRPSDLFLGILLNQPDYLKSVLAGDNVVFRAEPTLDAPARAVGGPEYAEAGWPASAVPAYFVTLRDGIRTYRNGHNGHNVPEIERCIRTLAPAIQAIPAAARPDERFVGHYIFGRCLAEAYHTEQAMEQFRAAIAVDSTDADAHMALLAELSIMTHRPPGKLPAEEEARWEREFLEELAIVEDRFAADGGVAQLLGFIFDPALEAKLDPAWQPHREKLRRVGYATFRWKRR